MANQWLNPLGALSQKENKAGGTHISTYQYGVNALGQRASVNTSGTAFATAPADWLWQYNLRGELASARQTQTAAASRFYEFDGIGNRLRQRAGVFADAGGTLTGYTANALNQYTAIGTAPAVAPAYDFDGNMTSGPLPIAPTVGTALVWDGENRLREAGAPVRYLYDALGRRVMKTLTGASAPRTYAIYDGWNLLAEYTGPVHTTGAPPAVTLQRSYAWGTDLSGSAQGAGGVGGLLAAQLHTGGNAGVYYPTYDGNGNVSEYLDNNGDVKAHYEYGPFGELLVTTGEAAAELPFRFSTHYSDLETGLVYAKRRYYSPTTGRWLSRDPLAEQAFQLIVSDKLDRNIPNIYKEIGSGSEQNIYVYVLNNSISAIDPFGLSMSGIISITSRIYLNGTKYTSVSSFVSALQTARPGSISTLKSVGHGCADNCCLGKGEGFIAFNIDYQFPLGRSSTKYILITDSGADITKPFIAALSPTATIELLDCDTASPKVTNITQAISALLPAATVTGMKGAARLNAALNVCGISDVSGTRVTYKNEQIVSPK